MGKSRSVSFVIVYLMNHLNLNYEDAYKFVYSKRKMIYPNQGYIKQLKEYKSS